MALIPAGEFQMGFRDGDITERHVHKVYLDAFYMDEGVQKRGDIGKKQTGGILSRQ